MTPHVKSILDIHTIEVRTSRFSVSLTVTLLIRCAYSTDTFNDAIVICQTCRHGGHAEHILEWFFVEDSERTRGVCAVADCNCRCTDGL